MNWLSKDNYEETHEKNYAEKYKGTADWLLARPEFEGWFASEKSTLHWCCGGPGMGKSVLAANTLGHIMARCLVDEKHGVAHMYYDYKRAQEQDLRHVVRAMLKQLCRNHAEAPRHLQQLKEESLLVGNTDDFLAVAEGYDQLFIVVDGLDICLQPQRREVIGFLKIIVSLVHHANILITSRHETDINDGLGDIHVSRLPMDSSSSKSDIDSFVECEVAALRVGKNGTRLKLGSENLVKQVVKELSEKAQGLYVFASRSAVLWD